MLERWAPQCFEQKPAQASGGYAPETAQKDAVVDQRVLSELRDVMEDEYRSLVETYLRNAPSLIRDIARALANEDLATLVLPAHSLKSSSANLGAMQVSVLARGLEMAAREGDLQKVRQLQPRLAPMFAQTRQLLQAELQGAEG
jgi:HPt (histidine-containing phosphotransfer) domain-containing protein